MIIENIQIIQERIKETCSEVNRDPSEITLIAVSKTKPLSIIMEAKQLDLVHFGENKAQEFNEKSQKLSDGIIWHFIGHLQTNKVKYIINQADYIHSVDSEKLANEINKRAARINKVQKILIEMNLSGEDSKFGISNIEELIILADFCKKLNNIELVGLMTMAPYTDDEKILRSVFSGLKDKYDKLNERGYDLSELSMGMTNDYEFAIKEGATMLRIGTAIFGSRN